MDEFIINMVGVIGDGGTCYVSVTVADCFDPDHHVDQGPVVTESGEVTVRVQNASSFNGNDITVRAETCLHCNPIPYYLPNVRPTG